MEAAFDSPEQDTSVTYAEVRYWIVLLRRFTVSDIAEIAAVDTDIAERFVFAAMWHGIIQEVWENSDGEIVWEWIPLPKGPRWKPRKTPVEVLVGYTEVLMRRGMPIRLVDSGKKGSLMQGGGNRRKMKERDRRYERMVAAVEARKQKNEAREKLLKESGKWKQRNKPGKHKKKEIEELKELVE